MQRDAVIQHFRENPQVPVLIIGAGINGIGVYRDLALQGVPVLMVDRGDFSSGASAASSHMVHGGIRYLENGEFRLVQEAVQERNRLLVNAPHCVRPLPTVIPIFRWLSGIWNAPLKFLGLLNRPAERGGIIIKVGLLMYDAYTGRQAPVPHHRFSLRKESLRRHPELNPAVICTATYYDAAMQMPERICMELILDAEADSTHAHALNYVSVIGAQGNRVRLRDEVEGSTLEVQPQLIVNAAGPWVDLANHALGQPTRFMGGTKGSHVVLDHPALRRALGDHEFFFENDDGRIVLLFPLADKVLVGTSDIPIHDPDDARCTEEEVDYFLQMIGRVFPHIQIDRQQIVYRFSGVRPLPASDAGTTGQISRDHSTRWLPTDAHREVPVLCLIGGKWTTFRAFAETVTDDLLHRLGRHRRHHTRDLPIGGGRDYPRGMQERAQWVSRVAAESGLAQQRVETLLERYGTRGEAVAALAAQDGQEEPLTTLPTYSHQEIRYLARQEKVVHLDDLCLRRALMAMIGHSSLALLQEIAQVLADELGWSDPRRREELARTLAILADEHAVRPHAPHAEP